MAWLSELFQAHPLLATYYTTVVRMVFVFLALLIVFRACFSLVKAKSPPEVFAYLSLQDGTIRPITHWENVIGRDKTVDIHVDVMTVSRNHGALVRNSRDQWFYTDLGSKSGSKVNGVDVTETVEVTMGDRISVGGVTCTLMPPSLEEKQHNLDIRTRHTKVFAPWSSLVLLTLFQILTCVQLIASRGADLPFTVLLGFAFFTIAMWAYCFVARGMGQTAFEMETIAFFLCTLNLAVVATSAPEEVFRELIAILLGMGIFMAMCWWLRDLRRGLGIRRLLVVFSAALLIINILFGTSTNGSVNWVTLAGYSLQPSELVKIAFIFIGSCTLDEMYKKKNLYLFMGFSLFCLGCLAIMNDFGTAAIFFATFLVISFLRSGDFSRLMLMGGTAGAGALLMVRFIPHISQRFATWMHAWDYPDAGGWQQTRGMSAAASGGCFGLGAGNGWFHRITAADTDLVFELVSEEWGLIIALLMIFCLVALGIFAVRSAGFGRSAFFTIAACAATSLIILQSMMNVLGSLDIFPFTGVTLPFISNGGTSMLTSWGLLAFLKACDTRQNASLAVRSLTVDVADSFADEAALSAELRLRREQELAEQTARDFDEIYGDSQGAGTRRKNRRSGKNNLGLDDLSDDAKKWLQLDADGPQRMEERSNLGTGSRRRSSKSGSTGKSDGSGSGKRSSGKSGNTTKKGGGRS